MEGQFDWQRPAYAQDRSPILPAPDRVGWWMVVSLLAAIMLHVVLFVALGHIKMGFGWTSTEENVSTGPVVVRPVEEDTRIEEAPLAEEPKPSEIDRSKVFDEVEILEQIKDPELTMKPDVVEASYNVDLKIEAPALAGKPDGDAVDVVSNIDITAEEMDSLGKSDSPMPKAAEGQMVVDPGSDLTKPDNLDGFMSDLIKKGSNGKRPVGLPEGTSTLDEIAGLPENVLVSRTTMLPGDLLFEFNSATLRNSSKVGVQKIALVMDLNPGLYCWIDGHTDLVGGDQFNYDLSRRRAEAVKSYLVGIGMKADKIITTGLGKKFPIVMSGTEREQSINRRVEIKMRKTLPPDRGAVVPPPLKARPVVEAVAPQAPPKAILVKPKRAIPVQEDPPPPQAKPLIEEEVPPTARVIEEEQEPPAPPEREAIPPRAEPVEE